MVAHRSDIAVASRQAYELAVQIGFPDVAALEIELVVRELAANLITHAGGGRLHCYADAEQGRSGITVESLDAGPGIRDPELAIEDGFSTAEGSLGCGLGTVNRLMDRLDVEGIADRPGTRIRASRWVDPVPDPASTAFDVGVASRPHPGLRVNGDAFVIKRQGGRLLACVIDGLGHGPFAHKAAQKAQSFTEDHWEEPFENLFRGVARNCRGTRGVVMTAVRFDADAGTVTMTGIGNVEAHLHGFGALRLQIRRGVLGGNAPRPVITEAPLPRPSVVLLHSDGISSRNGWGQEQVRCVSESATESAWRLLRERSRDNDDATVLVAHSKA